MLKEYNALNMFEYWNQSFFITVIQDWIIAKKNVKFCKMLYASTCFARNMKKSKQSTNQQKMKKEKTLPATLKKLTILPTTLKT